MNKQAASKPPEGNNRGAPGPYLYCMWVRMSERERGQVTSHPIHSLSLLSPSHEVKRER
jgi:hypothetical protein